MTHNGGEPPGQLEREALAFHEENPIIWKLVCRYARQAQQRGFKNFSIDMIWNVLRWECMLAIGPEFEFKLPNNHRPYYARWYNAAIGEEFFRTCRLRSLGGGQYDRYGREIEHPDVHDEFNID